MSGVEPLSAEEEAGLRRDHFQGPLSARCWECEQEWPCPTAKLLATLNETRLQLKRAAAPEHIDIDRFYEALNTETVFAAYASGHKDGMECGAQSVGFGITECEHVGSARLAERTERLREILNRAATPSHPATSETVE